MSFGSRLYDLRIGKGMSQSEVGKAIGLSGSAIGNYEKGTREPNIDALKALSSLFNVDMDYLLDKKAVAAESNVDPQLTQKFTIIKNIMENLNYNGMDKLIERATELLEVPRYRK